MKQYISIYNHIDSGYIVTRYNKLEDIEEIAELTTMQDGEKPEFKNIDDAIEYLRDNNCGDVVQNILEVTIKNDKITHIETIL